MIAKLRGLLDSTGIDHAVIDVGGVGYLVGASSRTLAALGPVGEAVTIHTEMLVAEDSIRLVGFARADERDWYRLLTHVQGVGSRVALAILSALEPAELHRAVATGDKAMVARANGVGPKLAQRIVNELKDKIDIQVVAFPQDGLLSYPGGEKLLEEALEIGADVVGGIPHFEYTRELGVASMERVIELAIKYDRLVDVHCDEIDDPNSRFLEVLAYEALRHDLGSRVTASHTTAMHSYNNAYCSKLFLLLKRSGINFVSCPTESIHLQGRFDSSPKRRGVTRVKELNDAGINVCLAEDSIVDPWYSLGNGKLLRTLDFGLHICHMMGYQDFSQALSLITDNSARTLNIEERYGIEVGKPASFNLLDGEDDYSVLRIQGDVLLSVRHGEIIMQREPARVTTPPWLG